MNEDKLALAVRNREAIQARMNDLMNRYQTTKDRSLLDQHVREGVALRAVNEAMRRLTIDTGDDVNSHSVKTKRQLVVALVRWRDRLHKENKAQADQAERTRNMAIMSEIDRVLGRTAVAESARRD